MNGRVLEFFCTLWYSMRLGSVGFATDAFGTPTHARTRALVGSSVRALNREVVRMVWEQV